MYKEIGMTKAGWARAVFIQIGGSVRIGVPLCLVMGIAVPVLI